MKRFLKNIFGSNKTSAATAKERLQIVLSHERSQQEDPDFLNNLQRELIEVVAKYVDVDLGQVKVDLEKTGSCSVLELNITLPKDSKNEEIIGEKKEVEKEVEVNSKEEVKAKETA